MSIRSFTATRGPDPVTGNDVMKVADTLTPLFHGIRRLLHGIRRRRDTNVKSGSEGERAVPWHATGLGAGGPGHEVLPEKTRIALHVRMSFPAFMPRRNWLGGHLVLARRIDSPRFRQVQELSPRNVVHTFRPTSPAEVDRQFAAWLAESYRVGAQEHLGPRRSARSRGDEARLVGDDDGLGAAPGA
jgi:hypothetical protein